MTAAEHTKDLEARVTALEIKHYGCFNNKGVQVDDAMRRARRAVEKAELYSATWKFVPEPYYTWPLSQRAKCLGAPTVHHLCKSLLMENKKVDADAPFDPTNPKFVLIVLQYAAELDNKQLVNAIRALRPVQNRLGDNEFDFRLASEEDNDRLTGYTHNSVTPFGLLDEKNIRIVLAKSIVPLKFFWMGGGHVHLKLRLAVSDFVKALKPIVAPISQPRSNAEDAMD